MHQKEGSRLALKETGLTSTQLLFITHVSYPFVSFNPATDDSFFYLNIYQSEFVTSFEIYADA